MCLWDSPTQISSIFCSLDKIKLLIHCHDIFALHALSPSFQPHNYPHNIMRLSVALHTRPNSIYSEFEKGSSSQLNKKLRKFDPFVLFLSLWWKNVNKFLYTNGHYLSFPLAIEANIPPRQNRVKMIKATEMLFIS